MCLGGGGRGGSAHDGGGGLEIALLAKCFLHNNENFTLVPSTGRSGLELQGHHLEVK